mgnify:CR=1 FL=1
MKIFNRNNRILNYHRNKIALRLALIQQAKQDNINGLSPQDTGGGGGNQTRKMNIGK